MGTTTGYGRLMSVILLTADGPEHRYVANRLAERVDLAAVVIERGISLSPKRRFAQLRRRYSAAQLLSRAAVAAYKRAIDDDASRRESMATVLGRDGAVRRYERLIAEVETVNRPAAHELVERLEPDRILVYGTGIVGDRMLERSPLTPLNLHTGISPHYRGSACAFWPIHNGEPEMVGATVHEICSIIDGGPIYATATAELEPSDDIHAVFARAVIAGARIYADVVSDLQSQAGDPGGRPQDLTIGTEYRAHMRGLRAEYRARRQLRHGLLDRPERRGTTSGEVR